MSWAWVILDVIVAFLFSTGGKHFCWIVERQDNRRIFSAAKSELVAARAGWASG